MMVLAVSGPAFIGAVVALALVVLWALMRGERDYEEESPWAKDRPQEQDGTPPDAHASGALGASGPAAGAAGAGEGVQEPPGPGLAT